MRFEVLEQFFPLGCETGSAPMSFLPSRRDARYVLTPEHPGAMRSLTRKLRGSQNGGWRAAGAVLARAPFLGKDLLRGPSRQILTSMINELGLPFTPAGCWAQQGHQLLTVLLFAAGALEPQAVVRLAAPEYAKDLLREKGILEHLERSSSTIKDSVPRVLGSKVSNDFCALAQTALSGEKPDFGQSSLKLRALVELCRVWLENLARVDVPKNAARSNRYTDALYGLRQLWPEEKSLLARMEAIVNGSTKVRTVITHRDFAAANLLMTPQRLHVIDWGNGHYGYPLTDFARFCLNILRDQSKERSCPAVLRGALTGSGMLWQELRGQAGCYSESLGLEAEDARALWLLSVFDYLAGYHGSRVEEWVGHYVFLKRIPFFLKGPLDTQKLESATPPT